MKFLKSALLLCLLVFLASAVKAQSGTAGTGSVSGKLTDANTKTAVGFASVAIFTAKDSALVKGTVADEQGTFRLDNLGFGNFYLKVSFMGYATRLVGGLAITETNPNLNAGTISLAAGAKMLSAVEVVGEKGVVEYALDKQVINVAKDLTSVGGTASDALKNVPSVAVDIDGNVSLRGSSNVTVFIDGKNTGQSAQTILSQTPASSIDRIEVITNPSAKYDAEGMGGIINIILKKETRPGLNGNVMVNAGNSHNYNTSLGLNYRYKKLNFFGSYDFNRMNRSSHYELDRSTTFRDTTLFLEQRQTSQRVMNIHSPKIGVDYNLSDKQTITFSVKAFINGHADKETVRYHLLSEAQQPEAFYTRLGDNDNKIQGIDYALSYRKTFDKKRQEFTASAVYTTIEGEFNRRYNQFNTDAELNETNGQLRQNFRQTFEGTPFFAQADYVHPVGEKGKFETGAKQSQRVVRTDFRWENYNYTTNQFEADNRFTNEFGFGEYVTAAYVNYGNAWKKISYQAGLRAEQTNTRGKNYTTGENIPNSYLNLFPSVFLSQELDANRKVQVNYSRRLNRPNYEALNPFTDYTDPLNTRSGNPYLRPELIDSYEGSFIKFWSSGSFTGTGFFRQVHNVIQQVRVPEGADRTHTTYVNLNDGTSYGLELSGAQALAKWWRLNGNVSAFNYKIAGQELGIDAGSSRFSWLGRINSNFNLPQGLSVQLSTNYRSPQALAQGTREAVYHTDIAIKKELLNKRASATLRVSDIFNTLEWNSHTAGSGLNGSTFTYDLDSKRQSRFIYLGFSYRFGRETERRPKINDTNLGEGMF